MDLVYKEWLENLKEKINEDEIIIKYNLKINVEKNGLSVYYPKKEKDLGIHYSSIYPYFKERNKPNFSNEKSLAYAKIICLKIIKSWIFTLN